MKSKYDLVTNIAIGFAIGAFMVVVAGGPEMWGIVAPEPLVAFIR